MSAKKTAVYHQEIVYDDKQLTVLNEHPDGTVDLGHEVPKSDEFPEGLQVIVSHCPLAKEGERTEGTCTIDGTKPKEAPKDK